MSPFAPLGDRRVPRFAEGLPKTPDRAAVPADGAGTAEVPVSPRGDRAGAPPPLDAPARFIETGLPPADPGLPPVDPLSGLPPAVQLVARLCCAAQGLSAAEMLARAILVYGEGHVGLPKLLAARPDRACPEGDLAEVPGDLRSGSSRFGEARAPP